MKFTRLARRTESAILRNMLEETLRVYEQEIGLEPMPSARRPRPAKVRARRRSADLQGFGLADTKSENAILRHLLAATTEAYEDRLNAFRTEKELVRHVLAETSEAVVTTDAAGDVTTLNPSAQELSGWNREEARGRNAAEILRWIAGGLMEFELDLAPCLTQGREIELPPDLELVGRDGGTSPVSGRVSPIHGERRSIIGAVMILRRKLSSPNPAPKAGES